MTTTVTVDVDEDELTTAAELPGAGSREETLRKLVANATALAADITRKRAEIAERGAADRRRRGERPRVPDRRQCLLAY
jgi:hypothetical protein